MCRNDYLISMIKSVNEMSIPKFYSNLNRFNTFSINHLTLLQNLIKAKSAYPNKYMSTLFCKKLHPPFIDKTTIDCICGYDENVVFFYLQKE